MNGEPAPDRNDEYLFYQALLGAWPAGLDGPPDAAFVDRMRAYMQKAVKEDKVAHQLDSTRRKNTTTAVATFVEGVLTGRIRARVSRAVRALSPNAWRAWAW